MRNELRFAAFALVLAFPGLALARHHPPRFRYVPVPTPDGMNSVANSVNRDGVVAGYTYDDGGFQTGFRFHHGRVTSLAPLPGYVQAAAFWINDEGDVCGFSRNPGINEPTLWLGHDAIDLGAPPTGFPAGRCFEVSDHDDLAVGLAFNPDHSLSRLIAFEHGDVIDISLAGYGFQVPFSTNRSGIVAAWATAANPGPIVQASIGFTYDLRRNKTTVFKALPGDDQTLLSTVTDGGTVYGFSYNDTVQRVVRFDPRGNGRGEVLRSEPLGFGIVVANDRLVVESYTGTSDPVILVDDEWIDLLDLIDGVPDDGLVFGDVTDMNERGDITAFRQNADSSVEKAFVLEIEGDRD